jgi:hypothetical protein
MLAVPFLPFSLMQLNRSVLRGKIKDVLNAQVQKKEKITAV